MLGRGLDRSCHHSAHPNLPMYLLSRNQWTIRSKDLLSGRTSDPPAPPAPPPHPTVPIRLLSRVSTGNLHRLELSFEQLMIDWDDVFVSLCEVRSSCWCLAAHFTGWPRQHSHLIYTSQLTSVTLCLPDRPLTQPSRCMQRRERAMQPKDEACFS